MKSPTRPPHQVSLEPGSWGWLSGPACCLPRSASAAVPPTASTATFVDLGTAATYSVLAGTGVSNTGTATVLAGDLGLSSSGTIAGFPPGTTKGTIHDKDAAAQDAESDRARPMTTPRQRRAPTASPVTRPETPSRPASTPPALPSATPAPSPLTPPAIRTGSLSSRSARPWLPPRPARLC